jgi:hypothetical protein
MTVSKSSVVYKFGFMLICIFLLQIAICAKTDDVDPASFKLYILKQDIHDLELGYKAEKAWPILQKVDLANSYTVITGDDIQVFNWSSQTFTLTQETTAYLRALPHEDMYQIGSETAFVITLNGKRLYGGCVTDGLTEMMIRYPVLFISGRYNLASFKIRPSNEGKYFYKYNQQDPSVRQIIEIPEVHDFFKKLGKLEE